MRGVVRVFQTFPTKSIGGSSKYQKFPVGMAASRIEHPKQKTIVALISSLCSCTRGGVRCPTRDVADEFSFLIIHNSLFQILITSNFGKNFFVQIWTTFSLEVLYTLNFPRYFLSGKLEKHELRRALFVVQYL